MYSSSMIAKHDEETPKTLSETIRMNTTIRMLLFVVGSRVYYVY